MVCISHAAKIDLLSLLNCPRFAPGVIFYELFCLLPLDAVNDIALQTGGGQKRVGLRIGIRFVPLPRAGATDPPRTWSGSDSMPDARRKRTGTSSASRQLPGPIFNTAPELIRQIEID
jgi:hypothetical protein